MEYGISGPVMLDERDGAEEDAHGELRDVLCFLPAPPSIRIPPRILTLPLQMEPVVGELSGR